MGGRPQGSSGAQAAAPKMDDQLDDILNELLSGDMLHGGSEVVAASNSVSPNEGSITTQSGNSRTVVSWQTSQAGPGARGASVTKHTVSTPHPNTKTETVKTVVKEEISYTNPRQLHAVLNDSTGSDPRPSPPVRSAGPKLPPNAFSYGSVQQSKQFQESRTQHVESSFERREQQEAFESLHNRSKSLENRRENVVSPPPPPRGESRQRMQSPTFRERVLSPTIRNRVGSPTFGSPPSTLNRHASPRVTSPYKVIDYDSAPPPDNRGYYSDTEHSMTWLEQQQMKLAAKREGRVDQRFMREKQLVNEIQNASMRRRIHSESGDRSAYMNGPRSPERAFSPSSANPLHHRAASEPHDESFKSEKKYYVSGVERPPFTTHQTKYTFSVSSSKDNAGRSKPPPSPSPALGRSAPASPIIPQRSVAKESSMNRSQSMNRSESYGRAQSLGRQRSHTASSVDYLDRFVDHYATSPGRARERSRGGDQRSRRYSERDRDRSMDRYSERNGGYSYGDQQRFGRRYGSYFELSPSSPPPTTPMVRYNSFSTLPSPQISPHYTGYNAVTMQYRKSGSSTSPMSPGYVGSLRRSATLPPAYIRHRTSSNASSTSKFRPINHEDFSVDLRTHEGAFVRRVRQDEGKN